MRKLSIIFLIGFCLLLPVCERSREESPRELKLVIIGLDGATWTIINPLLSQGKLPNMQKLIEQGSSTGTFKTFFNPLTPQV